MQKIDQACVNTLRFLAAAQVEKAKSGHHHQQPRPCSTKGKCDRTNQGEESNKAESGNQLRGFFNGGSNE